MPSRFNFSAQRSALISAAVVLLVASFAPAQQQSSSAPQPQTPAPIQSSATLVPIRVVVRDNTGAAISNLTRDDFQILEDGKPQSIVHFSVATSAADSAPPAPTNVSSPSIPLPPAFELPSRYIAIVFDDAHLETADLVRARVAADKFLDSPIPPSTRIALLTTSGLDQVEFTQDANALRKAIGALIPHPRGVTADNALGQCPPMDYYEADLIINRNERSAKDMAEADALVCTSDQSEQAAYAQMMSTAHQLLAMGEANAQAALQRLNAIVNRLATLPGQRNILLVSPGFLTPMAQTQIDELIDRATRAGIFIHTLDARGLFATSPLPDSNNPGAPSYTNARSAGLASSYRRDGAIAQDDVMRGLAEGTGGFAFLNNNDLDAGFTRTVGRPEVSYLLAFAPAGLKHDGKFHSLQVKLVAKNNYTIEARRGFYAPKSDVSPAEIAAQELENAAYSRDDLTGIPFDLDVRYAIESSGAAKLFATVHVNATNAQFDDRDGHRNYSFTVVAALFDSDGIYVEGNQKAVELHVKDPSPEKLAQGITVRSVFDVKQKPYFVRIVVRDSKSATMSAKTSPVNITPETVQSLNASASSPAPANEPSPKPSKKAKEEPVVWNPPDTDARVASLSTDRPCPVAEIIVAAANRASELSNNLEKFDALEATSFEALNQYGSPRMYVPATFDYTVEFDRKPGSFRVQESRTPTRDSKAGLEAVQDSGVPAIALIFHPYFHSDFEMHCDGATSWNGQPTWLVRFHQIPGRPSRILGFPTRDATYAAKLKGRAWIAQDSGQILHLETNLEESIPIMNLVSSAISIDYAPVRFQSQNVELWLPQRAFSYAEYSDRRTIMRHTYSDFKLFSVQSAATIAPPKPPAPSQTPK
jgi:VWFA-related protein